VIITIPLPRHPPVIGFGACRPSDDGQTPLKQ
jgi:hypothetical protein